MFGNGGTSPQFGDLIGEEVSPNEAMLADQQRHPQGLQVIGQENVIWLKYQLVLPSYHSGYSSIGGPAARNIPH